ncbi:ERCC4 domain-containing protein [Mobilicoccus caccae]|uniref:ERCC4 domain-containing protein n=1 Tax=Mobilicoccus caccae TaxID=1859295 RepID=A0ABQ6ISX5_9MICO|nr:histone-like nucleoid-structuring protein Lsr2 [Mobilicoccus caccae]GMA40470.1 hypothetical protein GCM10025883_25150 [Mobilicoccus caccae]
MTDDFVIAVNPEEETTLPYLVRLPLGREGVVLKVKEVWPRTAKVYCHPTTWPADPTIVQRVPVRSCTRRGASIDLVLDRSRENRSQFVFTRVRGGREAIFWQSNRTAKMARPGLTVPTARASGIADMTILVDSHERYGWRFAAQKATTVKRHLDVGDYAVEADGRVVAAVERKSLDDLVSTLTSGRLRYVLAELATVGHGAVVVEDRYSAVFGLKHVRPSSVAEGLAECAVRFPGVPVFFADSRPLAQEWTYRFFGAALTEQAAGIDAERRVLALSSAGPLAAEVGDSSARRGTPAQVAAQPTPAQVRRWAVSVGLTVSDRGRIRADVLEAYRRAHA